MQQLTGLDNLFLCIDAGPVTNAVIGELLVFEPDPDPHLGDVDQVIVRVRERLAGIPPLRRVAAGVPVGINNQYLREVPVDPAAHVRAVELSEDGDDQALQDAVAKVMEEPLAEDRPMWELVVLRGLRGGALAYLFRAHHGIIDGPTLPVVIDLLSDQPSHAAGPGPATTSGSRFPLPEFVELLGRGVLNSAMIPVRLLSIQGRTLRYLLGRTKHEGALALPAYLARMLPGGASRPLSALVNGHQRMIGGDPVRPLIPAMTIQKTPFNGKLTERRNFVFSELSSADLENAARHFGVSVDDVIVAVCAGALRRYMQRYGEVPDRPLILCVPASIRTGKEREPWATHLSMLFAEFPTNVDDPVIRLRLVHDDLQAARETFRALPMHMLRDVSKLVPLTMLNVSMKLLTRAPEWVPGTPWNVVVASVPARSEGVEFNGLTLRRQWPVGFLTPGMGLNISVHTASPHVTVTFCGCPDLMPDLHLLARYAHGALDEMVAAADSTPGAGKPARPLPRIHAPEPEPAPPAQASTDESTAPPQQPPAKPKPRRPRVRAARATSVEVPAAPLEATDADAALTQPAPAEVEPAKPVSSEPPTGASADVPAQAEPSVEDPGTPAAEPVADPREPEPKPDPDAEATSQTAVAAATSTTQPQRASRRRASSTSRRTAGVAPAGGGRSGTASVTPRRKGAKATAEPAQSPSAAQTAAPPAKKAATSKAAAKAASVTAPKTAKKKATQPRKRAQAASVRKASVTGKPRGAAATPAGRGRAKGPGSPPSSPEASDASSLG